MAEKLYYRTIMRLKFTKLSKSLFSYLTLVATLGKPYLDADLALALSVHSMAYYSHSY